MGADMMPVAAFMLSLLQDSALSAALSGPIDESSPQQAYVAAAYADKVPAGLDNNCSVCMVWDGIVVRTRNSPL
eukprot:scaffold75178_cov18-Tisochrysis_lutea.AAC.1